MTVEISAINNKAIRKAAEKADEQGNLDGKLDENEYSVFASTAYKAGCTTSDILQVTGGAAENSDYAQTLQKMSDIEAKEKEIENIESQLNSKKFVKMQKRDDSEGYDNAVTGVAGLLGGTLGFGALGGASALLIGLGNKFEKIAKAAKSANDIAKFNETMVKMNKVSKIQDTLFHCSSKTAALGRIGLVVGVGALAGMVISTMLDLPAKVNLFKPHKAKVAHKNAREYEQLEIEPLMAQKEQLENEIKEMKSNL